MRGDMQVRFGGRYGKTYCRKAVRRSVPSLRLGRGGNIIALAGVLYASDHVPYLLGKIAEQAPHIRPISFSFRQQASEPSFQHLEVGELTHPALLRYLQERGINIALAKAQCKELHFTHNGKPYFAIGFPNVAGGFVLGTESLNSFLIYRTCRVAGTDCVFTKIDFSQIISIQNEVFVSAEVL